MYHVAYHVTYHVASHFYWLVFYMLVCTVYICESNSVELPINLFIIIIVIIIISLKTSHGSTL